jgi:hypothetical protein
MIEQEGHSVVDLLALYQVIIVEHEAQEAAPTDIPWNLS